MIEDNQALVEMADDEKMKKIKHPKKVASGGVGPCLALGIYNPLDKSGYIVHDVDPKANDLESQLKKIKKDYKDLTEVRVAATGLIHQKK